ncbi:MAG: class I SAM-dependent methyltransferase [Bryobacteraceae bacterium]
MEETDMLVDRNSGSTKDWRDKYLQKYYLGVPGTPNPADQWLDLVREHIPDRARVLEIGGGPVHWTTGVIRSSASEIVGLDIDEVIRKNPLLDRAMVYDGGEFPLPSARFDVAISRWVNEHLKSPEQHFREVQRVLVPGGLYIFRTVNLYHYKTIVARLIPSVVQVPLVRWLAQMSRDEHDPYPTYYRANSRRRIRAICNNNGMEPVFFRLTESYPSYGMASKALFHIFMRYERLVNSSERFAGWRHTLDCVVRKLG